jgi:hypothetical protein
MPIASQQQPIRYFNIHLETLRSLKGLEDNVQSRLNARSGSYSCLLYNFASKCEIAISTIADSVTFKLFKTTFSLL